ncbi:MULTISPECIES: hypothetical protein [Streptomyces]|uniref:hypothetical protein n=1 Tax=Streptomyces TaxID=1883 RepID=UPI001F373704|nr:MULTISPECIES: hypothetical protein [Streptomyces]
MVSLLASGCGRENAVSDSPAAPSPTLLPQKLTKPDGKLEAEYPEAPDGAPFTEIVAHELERKTLGLANATGKPNGKCPDTVSSKAGTTVTCTVEFKSVNVDWSVTIGDMGWSDNVVEYQAVPQTGLLTREGVARIIFGNNHEIDYALCNNIPEAMAIPLGETTYECEEVWKNKKPTGFNQKVHLTDTGPRVY